MRTRRSTWKGPSAGIPGKRVCYDSREPAGFLKNRRLHALACLGRQVLPGEAEGVVYLPGLQQLAQCGIDIHLRTPDPPLGHFIDQRLSR